jgi:hypothetical protein
VKWEREWGQCYFGLGCHCGTPLRTTRHRTIAERHGNATGSRMQRDASGNSHPAWQFICFGVPTALACPRINNYQAIRTQHLQKPTPHYKAVMRRYLCRHLPDHLRSGLLCNSQYLDSRPFPTSCGRNITQVQSLCDLT